MRFKAKRAKSLRKRFREFDIECVDVLIGKPDPQQGDSKIETLLEQLRQRQLSFEQIETYERQRAAAEKLRILNEAQAQANMQTELTNARVQVQIAESHGEADLARARKQAEQVVVTSEGELNRSRRQAEQTVVLAEADAKQRELAGRGEAQKIAQVGMSPKRRCCCGGLRRTAIRSCTPLSLLGRATCPRARSRWCRSACSSPVAAMGTATACGRRSCRRACSARY